MTPRPHLTLLLALALLAGCEEDPKKAGLAPAQRSQAVQGTATAATSTAASTAGTTTTAAATTTAGTAKPRKALCGGALEKDGKAVSKKPLGRRQAAGESELGEPSFAGGFTWVNFWAAWCVPCKEEIPRLKDFQKRLTAAGKHFNVMFVSLDDDERQLEKFMGEQPASGLRRTYWLREGQEREEWLIAAGVDPDPDLPAHLLVDSKGKVRCKVRGAIEDADYDGLLALLP